jgi:hypothetical protein
VDIGALTAALMSSRRRGALSAALAGVIGITILDVMCSLKLSQRHAMPA